MSERSVRMAKRVARDATIAAAVRSGDMTLNRAYLMVTGKTKRSQLEALRAAWRAASADERAEFLADIAEVLD
ncbi:MAG: hypothetical protein KF723_22745 [Rhizobiaceae bacterium]|nr:hypothetical protein [Rhizobiaceae bacterium]